MEDIRKLSVGSDYKNSMTYIVGQPVVNDTQKVHHIKRDVDTGNVKVWVEDSEHVVMLWKEFNGNMPMSIEYNINF